MSVAIFFHARVRLALLLAALAGLIVYAVIGLDHHHKAKKVARICQTPHGAPSVMTRASGLRRLASQVALGSVVAGAPTAQGIAGPVVAFGDQPPVSAKIAPSGGGYEMRWQSAGGQTIADVFPFRSPKDAAYYAQQAGGTACRFNAQSKTVSGMSGARSVSWVNRQGHWQSDVFFSRGSNAFRVSTIEAGSFRRSPRPAAPVTLARRLAS